MTWTATATGGATPLQYAFHVYDPYTSAWALLRAYGASPTVSWTPLRPGNYALQVSVRAPGSTAAYDAYTSSGTVTITSVSPTVVALRSNRGVPLATGTPVTWTAEAAGDATPLEYQFWLYRGSTGVWTAMQGYTAQATWAWTPAQADTYAVQVWVRRQGSGATNEAWLGSGNFAVGSGPLESLSLTTTQTFPLAPGSPITWTAGATGGTAPLQYQFWRYDGVSATWTVVQPWSATSTFTWTPTASDVGVRALQVWIRSTGSTATYDAYLGTGYFVIVP